MPDVHPYINNWWDDGIGENPAYIDAIYKNGVFIDRHTQLPLDLKEGVRVKIKTSSELLSSIERKRHAEVQREKMLDRGSILYFNLPNFDYRKKFEVTLLDDLVIERKGNRKGRMMSVRVRVFDPDSKEIVLETNSLNQAYTQTSVRMNPEARTHTGNAFKVFFYNGRNLEDISPF